MSVSYHGNRLKSPRSFGVPLLALALTLNGCAYICHTYRVLPSDEESVSPVGTCGGFDVFVHVDRWRGPSHPPPERYNWPHWRASHDDVYRFDVWPVAADSTMWKGLTIELWSDKVAFGDSALFYMWDEVEDARVDTLRGLESYLQYRRTYAPLRFISKPFRLPIPVPDTLLITFDMRVLETATEKMLYRQAFRVRAVVEKHYRWWIPDTVES
jgi:hypothetical protein